VRPGELTVGRVEVEGRKLPPQMKVPPQYISARNQNRPLSPEQIRQLQELKNRNKLNNAVNLPPQNPNPLPNQSRIIQTNNLPPKSQPSQNSTQKIFEGITHFIQSAVQKYKAHREEVSQRPEEQLKAALKNYNVRKPGGASSIESVAMAALGSSQKKK